VRDARGIRCSQRAQERERVARHAFVAVLEPRPRGRCKPRLLSVQLAVKIRERAADIAAQVKGCVARVTALGAHFLVRARTQGTSKTRGGCTETPCEPQETFRLHNIPGSGLAIRWLSCAGACTSFPPFPKRLESLFGLVWCGKWPVAPVLIQYVYCTVQLLQLCNSLSLTAVAGRAIVFFCGFQVAALLHVVGPLLRGTMESPLIVYSRPHRFGRSVTWRMSVPMSCDTGTHPPPGSC
jgi:hypothetical protein